MIYRFYFSLFIIIIGFFIFLYSLFGAVQFNQSDSELQDQIEAAFNKVPPPEFLPSPIAKPEVDYKVDTMKPLGSPPSWSNNFNFNVPYIKTVEPTEAEIKAVEEKNKALQIAYIEKLLSITSNKQQPKDIFDWLALILASIAMMFSAITMIFAIRDDRRKEYEFKIAKEKVKSEVY